MTSRVLAAAAILLFVAPPLSQAATNLNSSRSNVYRLTYPTDLVRPEQVKAILAELDRLGPATEAPLKMWLASNFKRLGVRAERVKKIVVLAPDATRREIAVLLLTDPRDEAAALAVTVKSSKSNSSD